MAFFVFLVAGFFWATATPGSSYQGQRPSPDDAALSTRLERHVRALSETERNLESVTTVFSTLTYLTENAQALGYTVERQEVLAPADNLIITIPGAADDAPVLILGAHYDTVRGSPGADDNASGVAALLELARALRPLRERTSIEIQMVFFANEEPPYFKTGAMGSFTHAQSIADPDRVIGMISLETMGYFTDAPGSQNYPFPLSVRYPQKGNFIAFVGDTSARPFLRETIEEFRLHARIPSVGGTAPTVVQGIDWSDHWGYSQRGIPAFMVTDTAPFRNPHYHRKTDTPDRLDYEGLALVVEALAKTLKARALSHD
ncbi:MAG: M20/M25/M40 family metallo-hydrolase [Erythrobacter sp.]